MIKKFIHNEKEYEIRSAPFENGYQAAVFQNGRKLCENVHLSFEKDSDVQFYTGERGLVWLNRMLEEEVKAGNL